VLRTLKSVNTKGISYAKKAAILLTGTVITFALVGCGSGDEGNKGSGEVETQEARVPDAAATFTAEPSDSKVKLDWTAPANNGGAAVTGYILTKNDWEDTTKLSANALTHTFEGLTNNVTLTFKIRAVNEKGAGAEKNVGATPRSEPNTYGSTPVTPSYSQTEPADDRALVETLHALGYGSVAPTAQGLVITEKQENDTKFTFIGLDITAVGANEGGLFYYYPYAVIARNVKVMFDHFHSTTVAQITAGLPEMGLTNFNLDSVSMSYDNSEGQHVSFALRGAWILLEITEELDSDDIRRPHSFPTNLKVVYHVDHGDQLEFTTTYTLIKIGDKFYYAKETVKGDSLTNRTENFCGYKESMNVYEAYGREYPFYDKVWSGSSKDYTYADLNSSLANTLVSGCLWTKPGVDATVTKDTTMYGREVKVCEGTDTYATNEILYMDAETNLCLKREAWRSPYLRELDIFDASVTDFGGLEIPEAYR
jgi:hypothetical protein